MSSRRTALSYIFSALDSHTVDVLLYVLLLRSQFNVSCLLFFWYPNVRWIGVFAEKQGTIHKSSQVRPYFLVFFFSNRLRMKVCRSFSILANPCQKQLALSESEPYPISAALVSTQFNPTSELREPNQIHYVGLGYVRLRVELG